MQVFGKKYLTGSRYACKNREVTRMMQQKHNIPSPSVGQPLVEPASGHAPSSRKKYWLGLLKKVGIGGFLFFLIKGLLWLAIPALFFLFRS
jgi:hypothetical protein